MRLQLNQTYQMLSVTCDNASCNDTMVNEMAVEIDNFSEVNRTRCFLHIVNLVAKSLLKPFETIKKGLQDDALQRELDEMAEDLELEEVATQAFGNGVCDDDESTEDDIDGLVDEMEDLSEEERTEIRAQIRPVMLVLAKVSEHCTSNGATHQDLVMQLRKLAFKTIHSTTILLPAWDSCFKEIDEALRRMPRDVRTRWNSTYDMLAFALKYRNVIENYTADRKNNLRPYELSEKDWDIIQQLCDILKACAVHFP